MKIKSIEVWKLNLGNTRPYTIAFKTVSDVDCVFLKLNLENGIYGMGAANPSQQVVGESIDDTLATLSEENTGFLVGRDIREFYGLLDDVLTRFPKTPAARAAMDIAIHDAFTKFLNIPLATFLGQKIRKMETSVTIGIKNVEETLEEAREYYGMGFRCLKVKTGRAVDEDIERIVKLRELYSGGVRVRVDANQGYDEKDLLKFYEKTKSLDIELVEQPVKASEIQLLKGMPEEVKALIAVDESLLSPENAFELASPPNAGKIFNIKLMKSGGIYPARQIAQIARVSGTDLMWGCNDESAVSIAAALHAALTFNNTRYIDLDGSLDLVVDAVKGGFVIENGWMSVTDKPGLGVELIN
jgi:L-alanine-DL-glutamate epimerase-like enolase superfamily enzyme